MSHTRKLALIGLGIGLVAVGIACEPATSPPPPSTDYWAPLQEGARRIYDVELKEEGKGVTEGAFILRGGGTFDFLGREYFREVQTYDGIPLVERVVVHWRLGDDGIYIRNRLRTAVQPKHPRETLALPLPPTVGSRWDFKIGTFDLEMRIVGIEDVDTGHRTYRDCVKVEATSREGTTPFFRTQYYSLDSGIVRTVTEGPFHRITEVLREELPPVEE